MLPVRFRITSLGTEGWSTRSGRIPGDIASRLLAESLSAVRTMRSEAALGTHIPVALEKSGPLRARRPI